MWVMLKRRGARQVQGAALGVGAAFKGPWDCLRQRTRALGVRIGMFRGFLPTLLRDAPSFGAWFLTYEFLKQAGTRPDGTASVPTQMLAGGTAGVACWIITFPIDVVKSVVQTLPDHLPEQQYRMMVVARGIARQRGIR